MFTMSELIKYIGSDIKFEHKKNKIIINNKNKNLKTIAPYKL